jgi:nicotinate-nucleotide adenylyltransferase
MRIGVFGGAFDPPHAAHRALVEAALAQLQLDQLRILPTGHAWHKTRALSAAEHRLAMARLAFADLAHVVVDPRETLRAGPSYTVDTLRQLHAEYPGAQFHLVIGQDQAAALPTWREWEEVVRLAIICVAARPDLMGSERPFVPPAELGQCYRQLNFPHLPVSATDIRQRFAGGQGVVPLVCDAVARYIVDHHLYPSA